MFDTRMGPTVNQEMIIENWCHHKPDGLGGVGWKGGGGEAGEGLNRLFRKLQILIIKVRKFFNKTLVH